MNNTIGPRVLFYTLAGAVATLCAGASFGGGLSPAEPDSRLFETQPMPAFSFGGGYVGLQTGYLSATQSVNLKTAAGSTLEEWDPNPTGAGAGVYLGYNWQTPRRLVFGVEAEFNWADGSGSDRIVRTNASGVATENVEASIDGTAAIRVRFGYAMDRTLFYATAGWAQASYDGRVFGTLNGSSSGNTANWSETADGWTAGIGLEHALNDRWVARVDYRYADFGKLDYAPVGNAGASTSGNLTTSEIRLGAAMRF